MKFYCVRHAEAEDGPELQTDRDLTPTGEAQLPIVADFLKTQTNKIAAVLCSSDLLRGIKTGEYLAEKLDADLVQTPYVDPPGADEDLDKVARRCWNTIKAQMARLKDDEELVVVSHGPTLNRLVAMLLDCGPGDKMHYAHGTISHWDTESPDPGNGWPIEGRGDKVRAIMHWMVTPKCANRAMECDRKAVIEEALRIAESVLADIEEKRGEYVYDYVNVKRSVPAGDACEMCEECADQGWIGDDDVFDSGEDSPPHHPNCLCQIEYKEKRVRVPA